MRSPLTPVYYKYVVYVALKECTIYNAAGRLLVFSHPQIRIPVAVSEPGAEITIQPLCPPERHGHSVAGIAIDPRRIGRPYRYLYLAHGIGPRPCNVYSGTCRVDVTDGSVVTFNGACPPRTLLPCLAPFPALAPPLRYSNPPPKLLPSLADLPNAMSLSLPASPSFKSPPLFSLSCGRPAERHTSGPVRLRAKAGGGGGRRNRRCGSP